MINLHCLALLSALFLIQGCSAQAGIINSDNVEASSNDEVSERQSIVNAVDLAIARRDFAALNKMEREFRSSRARTPSGLWKLAYFHAGVQYNLGEGLERKDGCAYRHAQFVAQWRSVTPNEPAAIITDAALWNMQAWCIRGGAYASEVPDSAWAGFHQASERAFKVLEADRTVASVDPEYYAVMVQVYRAQNRPRAEFENLVAEAFKREPYYHRTYFNAARSYLPQWGGSFRELDQFARFAAGQTRESDKTGFYARIYWALEECGCDAIRQAADWNDMKQAMRDVYERYPVRHNAEHFQDISCRMGDSDEGLHYLRVLAPPGTSDAALTARIDGCKAMAGSAS